jgi:predicted transcriptional regulator of viral defense system
MKKHLRDVNPCIMSAMDRADVVRHLGDIAREQAGYVSAAQAVESGLATHDLVRLAAQNDLRRVARGVYALPGVFPGPREPAIAAWLRLAGSHLPWIPGEPAAVASHTTAATLRQLGTFHDEVPTFTVAKRRNQPSDGSLQVHVTRLDPADWEWMDLPEGIRLAVTTPARTIVDLGWAGNDHDHVLDAIDDALSTGVTTWEELRRALERRRRRGGRGNGAWLVGALHPPGDG